ncbi:MAG: PEGA domain-containing protein [Myxococcota bacterium]|nr:PEGA domain-containing protein [Myxococcota bacterium]
MLSRASVIVAAVVMAAAAPAAAERVVAIAPLSTVGSEDTSASTRRVIGELEAAVSGLTGTRVISTTMVSAAIKKAKQPQLRACELDPACLARLGKLVGANIVIAGEVVGIGDAKVIYLGATDVAGARELRSTTLTLGTKHDGGGPAGAIIRLLEPDRYRGTLRFAIDAKGATVYVNGSKAPLGAAGAVSLPVGTQAVRVTHPEYHDFVRFIDVQFGATTQVAVGMTQYPIVQRDLQGKPLNRDRVDYVDPPLWRRWYVVVPAALGLAVVAGVVAGWLAHDLPATDDCSKVGGAAC